VGAIGLALFLFVAAACIRAAVKAARAFERLGMQGPAGLARSVVLGAVGLLSASFFISNATDKRLWVLLALGPALAGIAARAEARGVPAA
jgi:hypothetical protein